MAEEHDVVLVYCTVIISFRIRTAGHDRGR